MSNSPRMGGVTLYFKKQWKVNRIEENVMDNNIGLVHIWRNMKTSFIIIIIYRSPSYSKPEFCEDLQWFLEDLCERSNNIITAGAFDIDWQLDLYKIKLESILNDKILKY